MNITLKPFIFSIKCTPDFILNDTDKNIFYDWETVKSYKLFYALKNVNGQNLLLLIKIKGETF